MKLNNKNKGFTLIELLVVIAIIGILSGVVLNGLQGARSKARNAQRLSDVNQIRNAMELYATASGTNKLPQAKNASTGALIDGWFCLGWDGTSLAVTTSSSGGNTGSWCPALPAGYNAALNIDAGKYLPNGQVITNTTYPTGDVRRYYRYRASFVPSGLQVAPFTSLGGDGAYLMWMMEGANQSCGAGKALNANLTISGATLTTCALKIAEKQ